MKTVTIKCESLPWSIWDYNVEINDIYVGKLKKKKIATFKVPNNINEKELILNIKKGSYRVSPNYKLSNIEKEYVSVSVNQMFYAYIVLFMTLFPLIAQIKDQSLLTLLLIIIPVLYFILGITFISKFTFSIK